ncbi:MAG: hypothetical protein JWM10_3152 [Myxococcaceae bacterium]|nr:hypothetical protein [Myxococcaceae bacterium]
MNALYDALQGQTSAMRLSAPRLRAAGGDGPIEAAVVLHEVERMEARALASLGPVDGMTRLRSAVERCGLLVEARNPTTVLHDLWPEVWVAAEGAPAAAVEASLRRLRPAVEALHAESRAVIARHPALARSARSSLLSGKAALIKTYAALGSYLEAFPGDWSGWQFAAQSAHVLRRMGEAWRAVRFARRFAPDDVGGWSLEVNIATDVLPPEELGPWLDRAAAELYRGAGNADVALAIAGGYAMLSRDSMHSHVQRMELLARADAAAARSEAMLRAAPDAELRRYVRGMQMAIRELRAGREPTDAILDRAGLPELHEILDRHQHDAVAALRGRAAEIRALAA